MPPVPSPIVGGWQVSELLPASDNEVYNLQLNIIQTKDGVVPAWLSLTAGLDLLATIDGGPVRAISQLNGLLYVLSGVTLYSVTVDLVATALGFIQSAGVEPVSMFHNTTQLMLVDGYQAWLVPGGFPLTGGTIVGGENYVVGDWIVLGGGTPSARAIIQVTSVSGGAVSGYSFIQEGAWTTKPTIVTQFQTTGSGSGFELTSPTWGAAVGMTQITVPFSSPLSGCVSDGFGLLVFKRQQYIAQSLQGDLSAWLPLDYGIANESPDNCVALALIHDQAYVIKEYNTEVWVDQGLSNFSFGPLQGVHMEYGAIAPFSVAKAGDDLVWLASNDQGVGIVIRVAGYQARILSTQALVAQFQSYETVTDAIGFCYQQSEHVFYILTFPTANETWCCDLTATDLAGVPVWHRRASFSNGQWARHPSNAYCWWGGTEGQPNIGVVGDYASGNLYTFNPGSWSDNGQPRKWLRRWRALPKPTSQAVQFYSLFIRMQTGLVPAGTNPVASLRVSNDGGQTWSNERISPVGTTGETAATVKFNRLGATRRYGPSNRVFELSSSSEFATGILSAEIDVR